MWTYGTNSRKEKSARPVRPSGRAALPRRGFLLLALATWLLGWGGGVSAAASREYQIKAAFLYHFIQFVEWPAGTFAGPKSPIVVATLGPDPFEGELDRVMANKTVGDRPVVVRHFSAAADVRSCQVLFVSAGADDDFPDALRQLGNGAGLLSVGETDRFLDAGGIIRFYEEDNRLRFEIRQEAATRAGLRVSAKLLRLSKPSGS